MVLERRASRHLWLHDAGQLRGCDEAVAVFVEGLESLPVVGDGWIGKVLIHDLKFEQNFSSYLKLVLENHWTLLTKTGKVVAWSK